MIRVFCVALGLGYTSAAQAQLPAEKFEAASVKLTPRDKIGYTSISPFGGATFSATNISMSVLVELAFGVTDNEIAGEDRLGQEHYDISAKPEDGGRVDHERLKAPLRSLLEERFKLVTHRETKDLQGYALVVAKDGPKLKENDGVKQNVTWPGGLQGTQISLTTLASMLVRAVGRPVVDKTGIAGKYDIKLEYAPEGPAAAATVSSRPSIFTALQEQLGLKLEPQKVSVEMLVIDRCERTPTEN